MKPLNLVILTLFFTMLLSPTIPHAQNVSGEFTYYFIVEGVNTRNPYDTFMLSGFLRLVVEDNMVSRITIDFDRVKISNKPAGIISLKDFLKSLLDQWINTFVFIKKVSSGERVYTGIRDIVVESYKVRTDRGYEIREYNTGVYLGGKSRFEFTYRYETPRGAIVNKYSVDVDTLIFDIEPHNVVDEFKTVEPPIDEIEFVGGIIALLILVGAGYTVVNWDKYNLDIFS